ncbi:MAG: sulfite exporter TauE/SafE family protein [Verrucomicrobia bacterium]|nr:MAG: sulfite exporter TauE/SafE family protein [Verrucomicrobiota bacterium]
MALWTAFLLGLAGSAHCAGMCGPLALALPGSGDSRGRLLLGRLLYNLGRSTTYALMGVVLGLLGRSLVLAGVQRWVSIALGGLLLVGVVFSRSIVPRLPVSGLTAAVQRRLAPLLRSRRPGALFVFGLLNGLLPCGLVYAAGAAAVATGSVLGAVLYMLVFGLGTTPMMLALGLAGRAVPVKWRLRLQRMVPYTLALVAGLLILRGMNLGIPYVSPRLGAGHGMAPACCPEP